MTCAGSRRHGNLPESAIEIVTAGLRCAPETGPRPVSSAASVTPPTTATASPADTAFGVGDARATVTAVAVIMRTSANVPFASTTPQHSSLASSRFAAASPRLRRLVHFDAAAWLATDPGTGLPTSPVRIDGLDGVTRAMCATHWQHELQVEDVNLFRRLAREAVPAGTLRAGVEEPDESPRFRRFLRPLGFIDELRTVLRVGDAPWGTVTLWRREGTRPFSAAETDIVAGLSAPIGEALRRHAAPTRRTPTRPTTTVPASCCSTPTARSCPPTTRHRRGWLNCHPSPA